MSIPSTHYRATSLPFLEELKAQQVVGRKGSIHAVHNPEPSGIQKKAEEKAQCILSQPVPLKKRPAPMQAVPIGSNKLPLLVSKELAPLKTVKPKTQGNIPHPTRKAPPRPDTRLLVPTSSKENQATPGLLHLPPSIPLPLPAQAIALKATPVENSVPSKSFNPPKPRIKPRPAHFLAAPTVTPCINKDASPPPYTTLMPNVKPILPPIPPPPRYLSVVSAPLPDKQAPCVEIVGGKRKRSFFSLALSTFKHRKEENEE